MKTRMRLMSVSLVLLLFACHQTDDELNSSMLKGVWVHTDTQTDTIDFDFGSHLPSLENSFILKRGKEIRDGYILPKWGSDIYTYRIQKDSIYLHAMLSSTWGSKPFYFKMNRDKQSFQIGSFAPFTGGLMVNTFKRIK